MKRKTEEDVEEEQRRMWNHGGKWLRGPLIGKGSFGSVFLATSKKPRSQVSFFPPIMAVKSAEFSASGSIQKEKEILDKFQGCPYVIQSYGEEVTTNSKGEMVYNMFLEYASGGTLADHIKNSGGPGLDESVVKKYTKSILEGIHHIHECGYVHCDLKPENILLVPSSNGTDFVAKIGDFGLAKRGRQSQCRRLDPSLRGTCVYLAPEAVIDNVQEPPSDIWALGCVVLEMLTGKHPWDTKPDLNGEDILRLIGDKFELPKIPNGISKEGKEFLKGCLVRKPMYRLTAEMLLDHTFLAGLDDKADQNEWKRDSSGFSTIETENLSFSLVCDDWEYSSEEEIFFSDDEDDDGEEVESSGEFTVEKGQERSKSSFATCDGDRALMRTLTQVSTVPAGV
nr:mitogen-activated protein kinase kinase kinase 20-like [Ziziphus jujuba var. spinosa]